MQAFLAEQIDRQTMDRQTTDGQTERQTSKLTGMQMDAWTDEQMDRQSDR